MRDGEDPSTNIRRVRRRDEGTPPEVPDIEVAALRYEAGETNAPVLLARGKGHTAARILELAEQHDLPVRRDPTLVSILGALDVGAEIPPDLYGVIAEVLAWAYHADQDAAKRNRHAA